MDLIRYIKIDFPKRYKRPYLSQEQMAFIQGFIPFSIVMQSQLQAKIKGRIKNASLILPSVIMGDIIVRSDWGQLKPASEWNNLALLDKETIPKLKHRTKKWDGTGQEIPYRIYDSWYDFSIDMTDHYAFSGVYDEVFQQGNSDSQLKALMKVYELQNITTYDSIENIVADYGLTEFDVFSSVA